MQQPRAHARLRHRSALWLAVRYHAACCAFALAPVWILVQNRRCCSTAPSPSTASRGLLAFAGVLPQLRSRSQAVWLSSRATAGTAAGQAVLERVDVSLARDGDDVTLITELVNSAYRHGELGILEDTPEKPLQRFTAVEIEALVAEGRLLVARAGDAAVGCVKLELLKVSDSSGKVGEWGGLAVDRRLQGQKLGSKLVAAAEVHLRDAWGCSEAQLELLAPVAWRHDHKERLRAWYVDRLGYRLRVPDDFDASSSREVEGTYLDGEESGKFRLLTDSYFTVYRRELT